MGLNSLVVRLKREPKAMATTVQTKHMTLYGMLKSGIGTETSRTSEWIRKGRELWREGSRKMIVLTGAVLVHTHTPICTYNTVHPIYTIKN